MGEVKKGRLKLNIGREKSLQLIYFRGRLFFCPEILGSVNEKFNGKNPHWTEDRKSYDQVSPLHENLRKSMSKTTTKLRPNYDLGGQKI